MGSDRKLWRTVVTSRAYSWSLAIVWVDLLRYADCGQRFPSSARNSGLDTRDLRCGSRILGGVCVRTDDRKADYNSGASALSAVGAKIDEKGAHRNPSGASFVDCVQGDGGWWWW